MGRRGWGDPPHQPLQEPLPTACPLAAAAVALPGLGQAEGQRAAEEPQARCPQPPSRALDGAVFLRDSTLRAFRQEWEHLCHFCGVKSRTAGEKIKTKERPPHHGLRGLHREAPTSGDRLTSGDRPISGDRPTNGDRPISGDTDQRGQADQRGHRPAGTG